MNKKLLETIIKSKKLVDESFDEVAFRGANEVKSEVEIDTKANEVMHPTNTGFGKELIPTDVYTDPMLDSVPEYSKLLPMLPWNQGNNMPISAKVPVIGEADMFYGNTTWTTGSPIPDNAVDNGPATSDITITQGQFILTVALSKRELNYSPEQIESIVRERINRSAARTIDAVILNADTATSGNVNTSGTPASTLYYMQQDAGIREIAISDANTHDVWALTEADFLSLLSKLDAGYQSDLTNLLYVMPSNVYNQAMLLDAVLTIDKFWPKATFSSWVLAKAFGIDILVARDRPALALATGKVHATTGNDFGSFGLIYKPAIQYGFGQPLEIDVWRVPGKWVQLIATFEFGFAIAYKKAGLGNTCAVAINVTM